MAEIRWDYEQISSFVDQLEACIDVLKDQQTFLKRFQADAAGSWANVGRYPAADHDRVKTACLILAETAKNSVKFKTLDEDGGGLEVLSLDGGSLKWRDARK